MCYRRDDSGYITGRIRDFLINEFGDENVFQDVETIPFGVNFKNYIERAVRRCNIMLVVVGEKWLDIENEKGVRRIDDSNDFVRLEIEAALERQMTIWPLFVQGVKRLPPDELPESVRELAFFNGVEIKLDPDFRKDIERLILGLKQRYTQPSTIEWEFNPLFLEHGKVFRKDGTTGDYYDLAHSADFDLDSSDLLDILSFPNNSPLINKLGSVSIAFLPINNNELEFVQLQRRREDEINTENARTRRWFNQTRFTVLKMWQIREWFADGLCIFENLLVSESGDFQLKTYDKVVGEIKTPIEIKINLPNGISRRSFIFESGILGSQAQSKKELAFGIAIKEIGRAILEGEQVLVLCPPGFGIIERLHLIQETERILLPVLGYPVTFTLDYISNSFEKTQIIFEEEEITGTQNRRKIDLANLTEKEDDDYIDKVFTFLTVSSIEEWQERHEQLYGEPVAAEFSNARRSIDAAIWLKDILMESSLINYYRTLFSYKSDLSNNTFAI